VNSFRTETVTAKERIHGPSQTLQKWGQLSVIAGVKEREQ